MNNLDPGTLLLLGGMGFMVGLSKGGLGGTLAGLIVPFVSIFMPVQAVVGISLPLFIIGDWLAIRLYWRKWRVDILWLTLPTALLGVFLGTYLLVNLPSQTLRVLLGIISVTIAIYKLFSGRLQTIQYTHRGWHGVLAGFVAGTGSAIASAGGPTYSAYLLLRQVEPRPFIGTTAIFFAITNLLRVPSLMQGGLLQVENVVVALFFIPIVWVGNWLGGRFINWVNPIRFEQLMIVFLFIAGLVLIFG